MARKTSVDRASLVRLIAVAFGLPALIAVVLLTKDALVVVHEINDAALAKERAAVDRGVQLVGDLQATAIVSLAMADSTFRNVVQTPQPKWIRKYLGSAARENGSARELVLIDPAGRVFFSSSDDGAPPDARADVILAAVKRPIERARALYASARAEGTLWQRQRDALISGIYASDLVRIDDQAVIVTAAPVLPKTDDLPTPAEPTLLVGLESVVGPTLGTLQSLSAVEGLMHVPWDYSETSGRHAHVLRSSNGDAVTALSWIFVPLGHAVLLAAAPAFLLSLVLILLMMLIGALTVHRLTRRLAESERAAVFAARHDAATGLTNRGCFMNEFAEILTSREHEGGTFAVLLIDCDKFKQVNDTMGHAAGDAVLRTIADRLRSLDHRLSIFSRLGGDEFAAVTTPLACSEDAAALIGLLERTLTMPVIYGGKAFDVSVSIGAAQFDAPSQLSIDDWLARADMALYRAKRDGRGCARIYEPAIDTAETVGLASAHVRATEPRIEPARSGFARHRAA